MSNLVRLKHLAAIGYGLGQPPRISDNGIPIIRATNISAGTISVGAGLLRASINDLPLDRAPLLKEGEILVVRSGAYTGDSARISNEWSGSAPGYDLRVTPHSVESRYLAYCLLDGSTVNQMKIMSTRAAQPHLNAEELGEIEIRTPPLEEQRRIADFLDVETSRVDRMVSIRRRQAELISERGISRAFDVIRGANAAGPRAESGLQWLGTVPQSWRVAAVGFLFDVDLGKMLNQDRIVGEHLAPYLRVANVQWDDIDVTDLAYMDFPPGEEGRYRLRKGDLLICEGGSWPGRAAIWDGRLDGVYYQKALHRLRARGDDCPRWLYYCLLVAERLRVFAVQGNTSTMTHLTREQLKPQRFPFPDPATQADLAGTLDVQAEADQTLIRRMSSQVDLLVERKQSLITAAVTGQFDVSTASGRNLTQGV